MKLLSYIVILVIFASCTKNSNNGYTIEGTFNNDVFNGYIYLNTPYKKDSSLVKNNRFSFTGKTDFPIQGWLTATNSDKLAWLYIENSHIQLTLDNASNLKVLDIKGSASHTKQHKFETFLNEHYKDANFDTALKDSLETFITENPSHSLSAKFLGKIASETWILSAEEVSLLKSKLDTSKQSKTDIFVINQAIEKLKEFGIGATFKDFDLYDLDDETKNSSTVTAPYLLVDFWASWCVPCRKQNPDWVQLHKKYHHDGFDILSISIEDGTDAWHKAIEKDHLTWNHLRAGNEFESPLVEHYQFYSIPYNILINEDRKIIGVNVEPDKLAYHLNQLLH